MDGKPYRWLPALTLTVAVIGFILTQSILAAPNTVKITSPQQGSSVSGIVEIRGTVTCDDLASYRLDYSAQGRTWWLIGPVQRSQPLENAVLAAWDTRSLAPGRYQLRLQVTDRLGNQTQSIVVIYIARTTP